MNQNSALNNLNTAANHRFLLYYTRTPPLGVVFYEWVHWKSLQRPVIRPGHFRGCMFCVD